MNSRCGTRRVKGRGGSPHGGKRLLRRVTRCRQMAHLTARSGAGLSIEMQAHAGSGERRFKGWLRTLDPEVAKEIHDRSGSQHRWIAEGKIANGADELLELTRRAGDLGLVKGVVGTRREF